MPTIQLTAIAQNVIIDQRTNTLSIINLLQDVLVSTFPSGIPLIDYLCMFEKEDGEPEIVKGLELIVCNDDEEILKLGFDIDFKGKRRSRIIINMSGLSIKKQGSLDFTLKSGESILASNKIPVSLKSEASIEN